MGDSSIGESGDDASKSLPDKLVVGLTPEMCCTWFARKGRKATVQPLQPPNPPITMVPRHEH